MSAAPIGRRRGLGLIPLAAAACSGLLPWRSLFAQPAPYPQRLIHVIVPNAPGSSIDTVGRMTANEMALGLKTALVIDNKAGAAGAIGMEAGRVAVPDGYTVIVASSSSMTVAPLLQRAASYDPLKDFDFITLVAQLPNVLICNPTLPVRDAAELVSWARSRQGKSNMASAGIGSASHLAGVALQSAAGFESLHVPYKGGSQGVTSVVAGETDWVLTPAPAALGLVAANRLRLLGHSMSPESRPLGAVPAIGSTVPGFEFVGWIGLVAPKGLPAGVADALRSAVRAALQQPLLRQSFETNGAVPVTSTAAEFRAFVARDIEQSRVAIRTAGIQPE